MSGITQALFMGGVAQKVLEYVGSAAGNVADDSTPTLSLSVLSGGIASSTAAGDLVIVIVAFESNTDRDITCSTSGYTEIADLFAAGTWGAQLGVFYKRLTASETSVSFTISDTSNSCGMVAHVWRNSNATTPLDVTTTTATGTANGVPDAPSITTGTPNAVVLAIGAATGDGGDNFVSALTVPSGMEKFRGTTRSGVIACGIASILRASTGAYNPAVFGGGNTNSVGKWCAATVAIRPA